MLSKVLQPTMSDVNAVEEDDMATDKTRTELDSRADMLVMGWNLECLLLRDLGQIADVNPSTLHMNHYQRY